MKSHHRPAGSKNGRKFERINKEVEIKARMTPEMRGKLEEIALARGESLSLILREAITEYLARRK